MTDHKTGTREEWLAAGGLKKGKCMYAEASPAALTDSFSEPRSSWLQLDTQTPRHPDTQTLEQN
jgi:hypothetical protein